MKKFNNLKVVEKFKYFAIVPVAILIVAIVLLFTVGANIGIDFAGGAVVKFDVGEYLTLDDTVKGEVKEIIINKVEESGFKISQERWSGDDNTVLELGLSLELDGKKIDVDNTLEQEEFRTRIEGSAENPNSGLQYIVENAVLDYNAGIEEVSLEFNFVGASASKLLKNAIWATVVAVIIMLIYIIIRFTLSFGLSAVICLLHDVLIMVALTTIFGIQINTTFIAAIITIVGYSINATIVLFDRVREIKKLASMKDKTNVEIANKAVGDTLSRSILTTITTLAAIVILAVVCAIMGITTMEQFALPIIFGLIAGTYSSILLAPSSWVLLNKLGAKIKKGKKA